MMKRNYHKIATHYENCLDKYGDTHKGVDWPNEDDASKRYKTMLEIISSDKTIDLLDFGCGASHLYEYILKENIKDINYSGLDISTKFIELSQKKFPKNKYYCIDIIENSQEIPMFDFIIMNGVFTEKTSLSFNEMWSFFTKMIKAILPKVNIGIAFNVMSKHVDWKRDDLFHVPFDTMAEYLSKEISRNFIFRNDYGLYEYTTYIYK